MTFEPEFLECFESLISIAKPSGDTDDFSKLEYDAPVDDIPARIEDQRRVVMNARGEEEISLTLVFTEGPVGPDDRFWLPPHASADAKLGRRPKLVENLPDTDGHHHSEVSL